MAFREGLYKVEFSTQRGLGAGVAVLLDGKIRGGDSSMYYVGSYKLNGDAFNAEVAVKRHAPGLQSVFGIDEVTIQLSGRIAGDSGALEGRAKEIPTASFRATLKRISD